MKSKPILFVSTVREWGGSEILWAETALLLAKGGYNINFAIRYKSGIIERLKKLGASHINTGGVGSVVERVLMKTKLRRHPFLQALIDRKPGLVIISTGSNIDTRFYMSLCMKRGIPYVTIVHLVTNILWAFIDDKTINELRQGYGNARVNYFVSRANLDLHNLMLGETHNNCKVLVNPFPVPKNIPEKFPPLVEGRYQIALVGRIELFHKGQDLLIQVLRQNKWKERAATFNIYGEGPHRELLERLLELNGITNVILKGYVQDIGEVWRNNHLLVLPSRMEGQALVLLEAMWCHRGALVTSVGGASELIVDRETGFMSAFPTVFHIDATLEKAWSVREDWEQIGRNAGRKIREVYSTNSIEEFAKQVEGVFDATVSKRELTIEK